MVGKEEEGSEAQEARGIYKSQSTGTSAPHFYVQGKDTTTEGWCVMGSAKQWRIFLFEYTTTFTLYAGISVLDHFLNFVGCGVE